MKLAKKDMVEISIDNLLLRSQAPTDIYIRLSDEKFVRLMRSGEKRIQEIAGQYKDKSLRELYVLKGDVSQFTASDVDAAKRAVLKSNISTEEKAKFVSTAATSVYRELEKIGFSAESFDKARTVTDSAVTVVKARKNLIKLLEALNKNDDKFVKHSMAVSAISILIAQVTGWNSPEGLGKLALGAFLHDVGKLDLPADLRMKPKSQMTDMEYKIYEGHPRLGVKTLKSMEDFPQEILAIVLQHHENAKRTGFPNRPRNHDIHPMAKIVAVADCFCDLVVMEHQPFGFKMGTGAIKHIEKILGQPFDKEVFGALKVMLVNEFQQNSSEGE